METPGDAEVDVLGDVLGRDRRTDDPAIRARGVEYTYHDFVTTAWKTANFFSHRGVHTGATVAVVDDHAVPAVLALFGAAQLGATTRFVPRTDDGTGDATVTADLLVGPGESVLEWDLPAGATRVAYTAETDGVDDPAVEPFGRSVWSENPVEPPETVDPGRAALAFDGETASHRELLREATVEAADLTPGDSIVLRASLTRRDAVVEGLLAPLIAGASIVLLGPVDSADGHEPTLVVE